MRFSVGVPVMRSQDPVPPGPGDRRPGQSPPRRWGGLTFVTITFPHYLTDSLEDLMEVVRKGWRSLVSGSGYRGKKDETTGGYAGGAKNRWGILGNIRAIEITDGDAHGWHPHLHVLCFHDTPLSPEDGSLQEFRAWWSNRWARWVKRNLGRDIHTERGVDAVPVKDNDGLGEYVSKIHYELVRSDLKRGRRENRTPWQIALDAADTGECRDIARWVEYCQATKGPVGRLRCAGAAGDLHHRRRGEGRRGSRRRGPGRHRHRVRRREALASRTTHRAQAGHRGSPHRARNRGPPSYGPSVRHRRPIETSQMGPTNRRSADSRVGGWLRWRGGRGSTSARRPSG